MIWRFAALAAALVGSAFGQSPNGIVSGTITDTTGAHIANVDVVALQTATGLTFRARSSEDGTYVIPSIRVGPIEISATAQGFKKFVRSGLTLEVDQRLRVDIVLEVGGVSETITVTAEVPRVDTDDST